MRELEQRLKKELQQNIKVKIMHSAMWSIPIHSIEIEYKTVKRIKMDILMKMMLISFRRAEITNAEELSSLLFVEQLFIQDLIQVMLKTRLIEKNGSFYQLTTKGSGQLENGIFEEEQEAESRNILYSPCHEAFLGGEIKGEMVNKDGIEMYRYVKEGYLDVELSFEKEPICLSLQRTGAESSEGEVQTIISEIISTTDLYIDDVLCLEFILYNEEEDVLYARVWNTLLESWDERLETQLNEIERVKWREMYFS